MHSLTRGCILRTIRGFGCSTFVAKPGPQHKPVRARLLAIIRAPAFFSALVTSSPFQQRLGALPEHACAEVEELKLS